MAVGAAAWIDKGALFLRAILVDVVTPEEPQVVALFRAAAAAAALDVDEDGKDPFFMVVLPLPPVQLVNLIFLFFLLELMLLSLLGGGRFVPCL